MLNIKTMNIKNIISNIKTTIIADVKNKVQHSDVINSLFMLTLSDCILLCIRTPYGKYRGRAY